MFQFLVFLFGTICGSFVNVVVFRYGTESVVFPRSHCTRCHKIIAWYDNIPILSWILLGARCRNCKKPISWQYPLVELLSGMGALLAFSRFGYSSMSICIFVALLSLLTIGLIDFRIFVIPLAPLVVILICSLGASSYHYSLWLIEMPGGSFKLGFLTWFLPKIIGGIAGFVVLASILVISTYMARKSGRIEKDQLAMGWGDPLLVGTIGAFLGWQALAWVVMLGCIQGIIYFFLMQRLSPTQQAQNCEDADIPQQSLPLGTFLCLAAIELVIFWPAFKFH